MRLTRLSVKNFRSIKESGPIRVEALQAFVGENNAGKSNVLKAVNCFLTSGAGGIQPNDFNDPDVPVIIEAEFSHLLEGEKRRLRQYLIGGKLILQKILAIEEDAKTGKQKVSAEYHGYQAQPRDWWLSIEKILSVHGDRPKWKEIAEENGILEYVQAEGKVNKGTYKLHTLWDCH